jgi:hypothetical protein
MNPTRINITPNRRCCKSKHKAILVVYGQNGRGLFLFKFGRPPPNWSVVLGPETNFLFPPGVSSVGGSRMTNCFLKRGDRLQLKSGAGIPEMNQKGEPAPGIEFICGPGKTIFTSDELCC